MEQSVVRWAESEFGSVKLGDKRRTRRLVQMAAGVAGQVGSALSSVCGKSGAQAVSRLLGREETKIEPVLATHIEQTAIRCKGMDRVLAVQDTTALDFSTHESAVGLGPISGSQKSRGLLMHSVLAVSVEKTPMGLLGVQVWARDGQNRGCSRNRRQRATSEKESQKWLIGLEQAQSATSADQALLVIGDRESDVYALFTAPRRENVDLLVRVAHDRVLADGESRNISEAVSKSNVLGHYELEVPRRGKRPKRKARLQVRTSRVVLKPPHNRTSDVPNETVIAWIVQACEIDVVLGQDGLCWTLLTTEAVDDLDGALSMIRFYTVRWVIEEFHRVIKSGCRVEQMQFENIESMLPAIAILSVVAWRVLNLTKRARENPDADASLVASPDELQALRFWLCSKDAKNWEIITVRDYNIAVARLGGFLGRKSDGMPGTKTTWQGLRNLEYLVEGFNLARQLEM